VSKDSRDKDTKETSVEEEVKWTEEALRRVENAPSFVRPGIRKLMVQRAKKRGYKEITSEFLTEIRNESMMLVSRVIKNFGFEELSMDAFEEAKKRMKRHPRKLEVIEEIKDFLNQRVEKKEEIMEKFAEYLEIAPKSGVPWNKAALERIEKVPPFVRGMAKRAIEEAAKKRGDKMVSAEVVEAVYKNMLPPEVMKIMGITVEGEGGEATCPMDNIEEHKNKSEAQDLSRVCSMPWDPEALETVKRIPISFVREMSIKRIEEYARDKGKEEVDIETFKEARFKF